MLRSIVEHVGGCGKGDVSEQVAWEGTAIPSSAIRQIILEHVEAVIAFLSRPKDQRRFDEVERGVVGKVFALGRLFLAYFLAVREENSAIDVSGFSRGSCRISSPRRRFVGTFFGRVRYWRTQLRPREGVGIFPLDLALRLPADGFSMFVVSLCARLATLVSFDQVTALLLEFLSWSPSKTTVEKAVLGLGRYTSEWFDEAPAPEGDGEVLVIQIDSKATPTATEAELEKRRGKRDPIRRAPSPRHRGRLERQRRGPRTRRKKGDKSKNGKAATLVVMYTLKRSSDEKGKPLLLGPINRKVYASYAPRRHAFVVARKQADKRGFTRKSGKTIQVVTDGDRVLGQCCRDFFPEATHTLDIMHALEYLWKAGRRLYKEGSQELADWIEVKKDLLYAGRIDTILKELQQHLDSTPKKRRATKGRDRLGLAPVIRYLSERQHMMRYGQLRHDDYEIASGIVEGAVKHVIAKRFDNGGMRWIKERAEPLLKLRCIEINGEWDAFVAFVEDQLDSAAQSQQRRAAVLSNATQPLPQLGLAG